MISNNGLKIVGNLALKYSKARRVEVFNPVVTPVGRKLEIELSAFSDGKVKVSENRLELFCGHTSLVASM